MPAVPVVQGPSAAPEQLGAPRLDSVASPDIFNAGARQDAELAKGIGAVGTGVSAVFAEMKKREDQDAVLRAEVGLKDSYLEYHKQVNETRRGEKAKGVFDETKGWWDEQVRKQAESLGNDEQRRAFINRAAATRIASLGEMAGFESAQTLQAQKESRLGATDTGINLAARIPSQANLDAAQKLIDEEIGFLRERAGMSEDAAKAYRTKRTTELHTTVFNTLLQGPNGYTAAKGYLESANAKGEIAQDRYDNLAKTLKQGGLDVLAQEHGDRAIGEGLSLEKAVERARKELSGQEEEHVVARLQQRYKEQSTSAAAAVGKLVLSGMGLAKLQTTPEYMRLMEVDADEARKVATYLENRAYTAEARAAAREQRLDAAESRAERRLEREGEDARMRLSDPARLAGMTRDQVIALWPTIGRRNAADLVNRWDHLKASGDNYQAARIEKDTFNRLADAAGFKVFEQPSRLSTEEKREINALHDAVTARIQQEQIARGNKKLTDEEKTKVMQSVLDNHVMQTRWFGANRQLPMGVMSEQQRQGAYVEVTTPNRGETKRFNLGQIPQKEWEATVRAMQQRRIPVTAKGVVELWLKTKNTPVPVDPSKRVPD